MPRIKPNQAILLLLTLAALFGIYVRLYPILQSDFPLNDGGLFYGMTEDLVKNNFKLPAYASYNQLNIPYAYPPMGFYLAGLAQTLSGASLNKIYLWLPFFFSLFGIAAFYLLAKTSLESPVTAALATLIFALVPRAFTWNTMGGGMTRAPGLLFLLLLMYFAYRMFKEENIKFAIGVIITGTLVIVTHPERALHAAGGAFLLWIYFGRNRKGIFHAALSAFGILLLSAPWWIVALSRYGLTPFLSVGGVGDSRLTFWLPIVKANFTDETLLPVISILAIVGMIHQLIQKKTLIPVWLIFSYLLEPRSAAHLAPVQASMLAAIGFRDVIQMGLMRFINRTKDNASSLDESMLGKPIGLILSILFFLIMLLNGQVSAILLSKNVLSEENRQAMQWIKANTTDNSRVLIVSWYPYTMLTPEIEWFPALTGRVSIITLQGREWLSGDQNYKTRMPAAEALHLCYDQTYACVETWAKQNNEGFDYLYLSLDDKDSPLNDSLQNSPYQSVYESPHVNIFAPK